MLNFEFINKNSFLLQRKCCISLLSEKAVFNSKNREFCAAHLNIGQTYALYILLFEHDLRQESSISVIYYWKDINLTYFSLK